MTPQEIAKQAAELILGNALLPGGEVRMRLNMSMAEQVILSAAAKMVRQSGAVAAFEALLESGHETCDFAARCGLGDEETTKGARGALKLLRSISEGEGV